MAQNQQVIQLTTDSYTELTNADVTAISAQVLSGAMMLRGAVSSAQPAADAKGFIIKAGDGPIGRPIAEMFTATGIVRVWAKALFDGTEVLVDHA